MFSFIKSMITGGSSKENLLIENLDKAFFTEEEKSDFKAKMQDLEIKKIEALNLGSTPSAITRRFLAVGMFIIFIISYFTIFTLGYLKPQLADYLIDIVDLFKVGTITFGVFAFYFGRQALTGVFQKDTIQKDMHIKIKENELKKEKQEKRKIIEKANQIKDKPTSEIEKLLMKHEGFESKPYKCTANKLTIGYGRNIEEKGISKREALFLLRNDIKESIRYLEEIFPDFDEYPEKVNLVLINMIFNLGYGKFKSFKKFIKAIKNSNYSEAKIEMEKSKWANQVPNRAKELMEILK